MTIMDSAIAFDLVGRVRARLDQDRLLDGVERLLVACSAGSDSTALLELLARVVRETGVKLAVAHLDHGLRGEDSDADRAHVDGLAARHSLPLFAERATRSERAGDWSEAEGRRARHRFFATAAERWRADAVALGHTRDDQAETVLLNLARGCGGRGLAAMRPRMQVAELLLLRPLLDTSRRELRVYLREIGIDWRDDATNRDERFARNRMRARVVTTLEECFPGAAARIARGAALLADEQDWIEGLARAELDRLVVPESHADGLAIALEGLVERPRALQRLVAREALRRLRGTLEGIERDHVDAMIERVAHGAEIARDLPGVRVRRDGRRLRLLPLAGRILAEAETEGALETSQPVKR